MKNNFAIVLSFLALNSGLTLSLKADETPLTLTAKLGGEYNSNLTVEELDLDASVGGYLVNIDAGIGYKFAVSGDGEVRIGYDFSQSLHEEHSEFDFQSHSFSGGFDKAIGDFTLSADYMYFDTKLDGNKLMTMHILTPSISMMVTDTIYVQAGYTYLKKNFTDYAFRDANSNKFGGTAFFFFNQAKSYWSASLHYLNENAVSDTLDYSSFVGSIGFKTPVQWMGDGSVFKSSLQYSNRKYKDINSSPRGPRSEDRFRLQAGFSRPVFKNTTLDIEYEYTDRQSNVTFANYKENRVSLSMKYSF